MAWYVYWVTSKLQHTGIVNIKNLATIQIAASPSHMHVTLIVSDFIQGAIDLIHIDGWSNKNFVFPLEITLKTIWNVF